MNQSLAPREWFEPLIDVLRGKRIKYFRTSGNVGDDLIDAATRNFFNQTLTEVLDSWDGAELFVHCGGGSLGRLYEPFMREREAMFLEAHRRGIPCVILPQSLTEGHQEFPPGTIVFTREHMSHSRIPGSILVPDMALSFWIDRETLRTPKFERGIFLRTDIEQVANGMHSIGDAAFICTSWQEYVLLASNYEHIVTDRLHFAIAALLAGRRATLVPNSYYKNRSMYETWLSRLGCEWAES